MAKMLMVKTPRSRMGIYTNEKITCRIEIVNAEGEVLYIHETLLWIHNETIVVE
jgi:hypothetical protein